MIGPNYDKSLNKNRLTRAKNVHWLGEKKYEELPAYVRHFDVATIPFVINEITLSTSPVKLFEYMAAGKPIVATDLPECRKYRSVLLARDKAEFAAQLAAAIELAGNAEYRKTLFEEARANTWRSRFEQIEARLNRGLGAFQTRRVNEAPSRYNPSCSSSRFKAALKHKFRQARKLLAGAMCRNRKWMREIRLCQQEISATDPNPYYLKALSRRGNVVLASHPTVDDGSFRRRI